ncbi:MAG: class I SAM-dependent methyltransferase [Burkholderiales bacterium]|jgi:SAM-dependent methyltransferase
MIESHVEQFAAPAGAQSPTCPICGHGVDLLHRAVPDHFFGATGRWDLYRCTSPECNAVAPGPAPDDETLARAYSTYYTHLSEPVRRDTASRTVRLLQALPFDLSSAWGARLPGFGRRLEEARLSVGALRAQRCGLIADVGCGNGDRLPLLLRAGWGRAVGVDPDTKAVAEAKRVGLDVRAGTAERTALPDESVDAVLLHHVIEHVRDPGAALVEARRVLRPGGRVALLTPNAESDAHRDWGSCWRGLEAPRHLTIHTLRSLVAQVRRAGLVVECARSSARSAAWIDAECRRAAEKAEDTAPRPAPDHPDRLYQRQAAQIHRGQHVGDELLVVARRPR